MKVISVVVTYNAEIDVFKKQLSSLINQVHSLIIVDNGSHNVTLIFEIARLYEATFIDLKENKGLSFAQNIGIANAIKDGAQYILLLDQDSVLKQGFVKNMLDVYVESGVGILGPVFYDPESMVVYKGTNYFGPFIRAERIERITDVTYVIASGSFFSVDVYHKVGPMNEDLFVDYIDVDWSLRAKNIGLRIAMTNLASMSHTIGDSRINLFGRTISVHSPMRRYYLIRNSFFMIRQAYVPFGYKLREVTLNFVRTIISVLLSKEKALTLNMALKGIRDGILGCYGPYRK